MGHRKRSKTVMYIVLCLITTWFVFGTPNNKLTEIIIRRTSYSARNEASTGCLSKCALRFRYSPKSNATKLFKNLQHFASNLPKSSEGYLFTHVTKILRIPWHHSEINSKYFKEEVEGRTRLCTCDHMMLTRKNAPLGRKIRKVHNKREVQIIDELTNKRLSEKSLVPSPPYETCSVVGSSGILLGSQCGHVIDNMDFVFRFNLAPTIGYEEDVGNRTNMTTMNPSIYKRYYGMLKEPDDIARFSCKLSRLKGLVWTPAVGFAGNFIGSLGKIKNIAKPYKDLKFIEGDPVHFKAVQSFWKRHGLNNTSSSGFYFVSTALALCKNVHLFGFWPFNISTDGKPVSYHYYNALKMTQKHDMPYELKITLAMHHYGLLRLHVGSCTNGHQWPKQREGTLNSTRLPERKIKAMENNEKEETGACIQAIKTKYESKLNTTKLLQGEMKKIALDLALRASGQVPNRVYDNDYINTNVTQNQTT